MSNHHYTVVLPVKPYIKKYVTAIEGDPIHFDSRSMLCMIIRAYLQNKARTGLSASQFKAHQSARNQQLQIIVPIKKMWYIGHHIKPDHMVLINRFLEDCFERALNHHINSNTKGDGRFRGYKEAYHTFAELYSIDMGRDISYEGLKQLDFRNRKKFEKNFLTLVPSL